MCEPAASTNMMKCISVNRMSWLMSVIRIGPRKWKKFVEFCENGPV